MKRWQYLKLTILGKVKVLKSFAFPKLIYPLTVLPSPPKQVIDDIKRAMYKFLWDGKPDKIKIKILLRTYENGFLKMFDLDKFILSLKASWMKTLLDKENNGDWKSIYITILDHFGGNLIFECKLTDLDIKCKFQNRHFYRMY